VGMREEECCL